MVVDALLEEQDAGMKVHFNADDFNLICTGKYEDNENIFCDRIRTRLRIPGRWCTEAVLHVNPTIPNTVSFTRKCKLHTLRTIRLYDLKDNGYWTSQKTTLEDTCLKHLSENSGRRRMLY